GARTFVCFLRAVSCVFVDKLLTHSSASALRRRMSRQIPSAVNRPGLARPRLLRCKLPTDLVVVEGQGLDGLTSAAAADGDRRDHDVLHRVPHEFDHLSAVVAPDDDVSVREELAPAASPSLRRTSSSGATTADRKMSVCGKVLPSQQAWFKTGDAAPRYFVTVMSWWLGLPEVLSACE